MTETDPYPPWRRLPVGAEPAPEGGVHVRVWAPARRRVRVLLEGDEDGRARVTDGRTGLRTVELAPSPDGFHAGLVAEAGAGTRYRFLLDDDERPYPDPASRWQPEGPHGPSCVVDPSAFRWTDDGWPGVGRHGQVIYELHVGTFTRQGTWAAAARQLDALADVGITTLELLPVAEFPGRFGWGYDGVDLFAPTRLYGTPDDFRAFVDRAHRTGLGVILDVVYNHLGPSGNYLSQFSPHYFTTAHETDWGAAINFDGEQSGPVRDFFVANAGYWIAEFHLDGLRLDATQNIYDDSRPHILTEIGERVRRAAGRRATIVVNENEPQHADLVRPVEEGGFGLDMMWNDDWHHSAMIALTGRSEAYYSPHRGTAQEFVSAAKYGYLYQGQVYFWQRGRRGTPAWGLTPAQFVNFVQNHDQVANSAFGRRAHQLTSPPRWRALTALLLLGPQTPMLFQGQEFAASAPFLYFADHEPELAELVARGRREFLTQFPSIAMPEIQALLAPPHDPATFERCKLDHGERERHHEVVALHRDLLRLRREDPCFAAQRTGGVDGAVLGEGAFVLRFFGEEGDDRLLVVNLGRQLHLPSAPEPLLAPPEARHWAMRWSSEDPRYGGQGTPPIDTNEAGWQLPAETTVALAPVPAPPEERRGPADRRLRHERRAVPIPFG
jgi:maltooligosyltrehalose trehalohydrolase